MWTCARAGPTPVMSCIHSSTPASRRPIFTHIEPFTPFRYAVCLSLAGRVFTNVVVLRYEPLSLV